MALPLAPEHRTPSHVTSALVRFGGWLSDQGWVVAVDDKTLDAERHPGVRYRSLSPIGRMTRGALACRFDGGRIHLRYRPNWLAALFDVCLLALGYAITRKLGLPLHGSRWADAGVAFVILALVLPAVMLLVRFRFVVMLGRAVWSTDDAWDRVRHRGLFWEIAWAVGGCVAVAEWVLMRHIVPFLYHFMVGNLTEAMLFWRQRPTRAVMPALIAALTGAIVYWMIFRLGVEHTASAPSQTHRINNKNGNRITPTNQWRD